MLVEGEEVEELPHELQILPSHVGNLEDRADTLRDKVSAHGDDVIARVDKQGDLPAAGGLEDLGELLQGLLEDVGGAHVNLGHHDEHGDVQGQGQSEVFCQQEDEEEKGI